MKQSPVKHSCNNSIMAYRSSGFALLEVFIAMLIITILISGFFVPGLALNNYHKRKQTHQKIQEIQLALNRFLETNGRLPCPTNPASPTIVNTETLSNGECVGTLSFAGGTVLYGAVPTQTLGISQELMQDGWGNKILYAVPKELTPKIANKSTIVFYKNTIGLIKIAKTTVSSNALAYPENTDFSNYIATSYKNESAITVPLSSDHLYAIISYGENGLGAYGIFGEQNSKDGAEATLGENQNFMEGKTDVVFFKNPSSNLKGGKLDDIVYTASISDIVSNNGSVIHCDYRHQPFYPLESFTGAIPANSTGAPTFTTNPYYGGTSLVKFSDTCAVCPDTTGRRLYVECLQGGMWAQVVKRDCTC